MSRLKMYLVAVLLVALVAAFFVFQSGQPDHITLAINPIPLSAMVFIAQEKGYFAQEDLVVETVSFQTGKAALDALLGGGADLATTADFPIALSALAGQSFDIVGTIAYSPNDIQVVARRNANIESVLDLRGKKIATTAGGPLFFIHQLLAQNKVDANSVSLTTSISPSDMGLALMRGEVDAIVIFGPYAQLAARELGSNAVVFAPANVYGETWEVVSSKAFAQKNPTKVVSFLKALTKAESFLQSNPSEAKKIVARDSGMDENLLDTYWSAIQFELSLNDSLVETLNRESEWAVARGISKPNPKLDFNALISPSFLRQAKGN